MKEIRAELQQRILDDLLQDNPGGTRESIKRVVCDYMKELHKIGIVPPYPWGDPLRYVIDVDVENNSLAIISLEK